MFFLCFDTLSFNKTYQCITVRQRTTRYPFLTILVHFFLISLLKYIFFHAALFSCCTLLCSNLFMYFIFVLHSFYILLYFMFHFHTLQCFSFAFCSCCTLCMLQFLPTALCSCCTTLLF